MAHFSFGQQGFKLVPDGLDEVRWERGHGHPPSSGSLVTPRMIDHPVSTFHSGPSSLPIRASSYFLFFVTFGLSHTRRRRRTTASPPGAWARCCVTLTHATPIRRTSGSSARTRPTPTASAPSSRL